MVLFVSAYLFFPLLSAPWRNPRKILTLSAWVELFGFLINIVPAYVVALCILVAHVLPPSMTDATHETPAVRDALIAFFTRMLLSRPTLGFDEVGSASYVVNM